MSPPNHEKVPWILVCGSIALDSVGRYQGSFADYQRCYDIQALNISLQLADLRSSFGGCCMNIAYGLHKLEVPFIPLSSAGADFMDHYYQHLQHLGINTDHIAVDPAFQRCAAAMVVSDDYGNQITCFHAGASASPLRKLPREIPGIADCRVAILAPENAPIMLRQARDLNQLGIPIIFDPGQGIAKFNADEIRELLALSETVISNLHEYEILKQNAKLSSSELERMMHRIIVTRDVDGVDVHENGDAVHVEAIENINITDSTGCGDAFRAGYLFGLIHDYDIVTCIRIGCLLAAINLESIDTQTYDISVHSLMERYEKAWGESFSSE